MAKAKVEDQSDALSEPIVPGAQARASKSRSTTRRQCRCTPTLPRVTGTPEEMIIDLGLNPNPFEVPKEPIRNHPANHHQLLHREADVGRVADDRSAPRECLACWRPTSRGVFTPHRQVSAASFSDEC